MASGSTNPTIEEIKKLLEQNKYSSKDIGELRRDIAEASAVLSRYTTVKGKLFGELQEDKARLNSLKDEFRWNHSYYHWNMFQKVVATRKILSSDDVVKLTKLFREKK